MTAKLFKALGMEFAVAQSGGAIVRVCLRDNLDMPGVRLSDTPLLSEAVGQFGEYFGGSRRAFDLPLALIGADFRVSVWRALMDIPYGETRSYGDVAAIVGNPSAARAVGQANRANPLWIIVPCHRVVRAGGELGGYAGGLFLKRRLLDLEARHSRE